MAVRRSVAVLVALAAPFVGVAYGAQALVAPVARATASALSGLVAPLNPQVPAPAPEVGAELPPAPPAPGDLLPVAGPGKGAAPRRAPTRLEAGKPPPLFVSQAAVLKLAESAARPSGAFVPQTAEHPAGLRLVGVAGLGIGVQDGDILIEALGIAPRAPGEIIAAIIQARAKNARFLSGTLWRRGDTFRITVEQPYLPAKG